MFLVRSGIARAPTHFGVLRHASRTLTSRNLADYASKEGTSVEDLRARVKDAEREAAKQRLARAAAAAASRSSSAVETPAKKSSSHPSPIKSVRKDSSPIKPLSSILNVDRIVQTPHTADQIGALWTTYHASRSGGTGRGYICASVPRTTYESMLQVGQKYPQFIVPVPREVPPETPEAAPTKAHEFFILQWDLHDAPPVPIPGQDSLFPTISPIPGPPPAAPNARTATVIFTPLVEYKLRQTFAAPHLVLTFYTDFSGSHDVVLLRGEVTPRGNSPDEFVLNQQDAQLLAMGVQSFYLWGGARGEDRGALLRTFHEKPEEFKWEELVKLGDVLV
ncbi:ATP11 protein-domain-containing protein [Amylostereum chailletii]|nr:ATP11 protein-domain-containing protein [Amylostereum chailletii]